MDYGRTCKTEGYRVEDLKPEDRRSMTDIYWLIGQMEDSKDVIVGDYAETHTDSDLFNTMLKQFADSLYDEFMTHLVINAQGMQIAMAEGGE